MDRLPRCAFRNVGTKKRCCATPHVHVLGRYQPWHAAQVGCLRHSFLAGAGQASAFPFSRLASTSPRATSRAASSAVKKQPSECFLPLYQNLAKKLRG